MWVKLGASLVVVVVAIALFWPTQPAIKLSFEQDHCYLYDKHFSLQWHHSVEKSLWIDQYALTPQGFLLTKTFLGNFGAGTPSQGLTPIAAPKGLIGYAQHRLFTSLDWVVSRRMKGTILTPQGRYPIYQNVPDYTLIHLEPRRQPWLFQFLGNTCHHESR